MFLREAVLCFLRFMFWTGFLSDPDLQRKETPLQQNDGLHHRKLRGVLIECISKNIVGSSLLIENCRTRLVCNR